MPLREVSEIDEIIVNRITDMQFKQSFLNKKTEINENQKLPQKINSNDIQLGIQQHTINLIYNSSTSYSSFYTSSSSSECDSINRNNTNNINIHTKKRKRNITNKNTIKTQSFNENEITYVESSSSSSEDENKYVKKKSKIGNCKYNIVNIDDIPSTPPRSMKRRVFPIKFNESSLVSFNNTVNVPPNAVAQSFINKIKKLRRAT